jgi:hypothetical protein
MQPSWREDLLLIVQAALLGRNLEIAAELMVEDGEKIEDEVGEREKDH